MEITLAFATTKAEKHDGRAGAVISVEKCYLSALDHGGSIQRNWVEAASLDTELELDQAGGCSSAVDGAHKTRVQATVVI